MNYLFLITVLVGASSLGAQTPDVSPPLNIALRCNEVQTTPQSHAVKSDAFGFGNPTAPDSDQSTRRVNRTVLIELHGKSGRIQVPIAVLAKGSQAVAGGWFALADVSADTGCCDGRKVNLDALGQTLRIDRRTGVAEIVGYGAHTLRGVCRLDRKPQQF